MARKLKKTLNLERLVGCIQMTLVHGKATDFVYLNFGPRGLEKMNWTEFDAVIAELRQRAADPNPEAFVLDVLTNLEPERTAYKQAIDARRHEAGRKARSALDRIERARGEFFCRLEQAANVGVSREELATFAVSRADLDDLWNVAQVASVLEQ